MINDDCLRAHRFGGRSHAEIIGFDWQWLVHV